MFEAYKIGVKISLVNHVSVGLMQISRQMAMTSRQAQYLQRQLDGIKRLGLLGATVGGAGFMGLGLIGKALKPAKEYAHQLNIMNMAGLTHKQVAEAVGAAWKNTGTVITSTATENLKSLLDMRNLLGSMPMAMQALPTVSRIQAVLAASQEGRVSGQASNFAYSATKALDVLGKTRDTPTYLRNLESMARVVVMTQGRVNPEAMKSVFQYARQARLGLSEEFINQNLPALIQEYAGVGGGGGGSRGVGPMLAATYRWAVQGYINKKAMPELKAMGLIDAHTALKTTTKGTTVGAMKNWQLASSNPFQWANQVLLPAMEKRYGKNMTEQQLQFHINQLTRGNQLAGQLLDEFILNAFKFRREQRLYKQAKDSFSAYRMALSNDPETAEAALHAQWKNAKTAFWMGVIPTLVPMLTSLANGLNAIGMALRKNPDMAKKLAVGLIALAGAMAFSGTVLLLTAGFRALGVSMMFIGVVGPAKIAMGLWSFGRAVLFMGLGGVKAVWTVTRALMLFGKALIFQGLAQARLELIGLAGALHLVGSAGAVILAAYAGYKAGGWLNDKINDGVQGLTGGKEKNLGSWIYDLAHPSNVSSNVTNVPRHGVVVQLHHTSVHNIDGKQVAKHLLPAQNLHGSTDTNFSAYRPSPALGR